MQLPGNVNEKGYTRHVYIHSMACQSRRIGKQDYQLKVGPTNGRKSSRTRLEKWRTRLSMGNNTPTIPDFTSENDQGTFFVLAESEVFRVSDFLPGSRQIWLTFITPGCVRS